MAEYEGRHRVERIEQMLEKAGWGFLRFSGERRRLVDAHNKASRVMRWMRDNG